MEAATHVPVGGAEPTALMVNLPYFEENIVPILKTYQQRLDQSLRVRDELRINHHGEKY